MTNSQTAMQTWKFWKIGNFKLEELNSVTKIEVSSDLIFVKFKSLRKKTLNFKIF